MRTLLNNLNEIFVGIILGLFAGYSSYKLLRYQETKTYSREQYELVIFPIFIMIEPFLYACLIDEQVISVVKQVCNHVKQNRMYINGQLFEIVDFCTRELDSKNKLSKDSFYNLCSIISFEYDKACKCLGVGKRTFSYKFKNKQLRPDKITILNFLSTLILYACLTVGLIALIAICFIVIMSLPKLIKL